MIVGHIMARREERRQRKAQWMIGRCYPQVQGTSNMPSGMQEVKTTDIIIQEPIIEPFQEVVMLQSVLEEIIMEPVIEVIKMEPVVMVYSQEKIDEAETMRKLILLQTTLKKFSKKK